MNTATKVAEIIAEVKAKGGSISDAVWEVATACIGWSYVFGAHGEYCDPSNRRSWYKPAYPKIKERCKNFNGKDTVPAGCVGCQWFLGSADSDESKHEGRTRFFDCRGFIYWVLHIVCGFWDKCPAGATSMWNGDYWKAKGMVKDGVPNDSIVCLFYPEKDAPNKMAHVGFGYKGQTVECGSGVEYHSTYAKKWTHWAIPKCVDGSITPDPDAKPTLRRGDKGKYVTLLQTKLIQQGYSLPKFGADGSYGAETEAVVKAFQKDHGLVSDGIVEAKTWEALDSGSKKSYTVLVRNVSRSVAESIVNQYGGVITEEDVMG